MSGGGGGEGSGPQLNVVSMVDVIFNVIVFFIITAKAASDEMVKMVVPKVQNPNMYAMPSNVPRLIVSVVSDPEDMFQDKSKILQKEGPIAAMMAGSSTAREVRVGSKKFKIPTNRYVALPELTAEIQKAKRERLAGHDPSVKLEVLLRADLALPYGQVSPIMDAIAAAGIENINLMAYQKN